MYNELVYGKNKLGRIVSIEPGDATAVIFRELEDGTVEQTTVPNSHYLLFAEEYSPKFKRLKGNQPFKWLWETDSRAKYEEVIATSYKKRRDFHAIRDPKEALMVKDGMTYYKDMKVQDVSVLSFDIETNGLVHNNESTVFMISNTFRKNGKIERKLFSLDEHGDQQDMLVAWCRWVREVNPSVILGHNIFSFDIPYLKHVADINGTYLKLGRDSSPLQFAKKGSKFRKDGSQAYDYTNAFIYGREIVDTYFLAMKYDIGRNYESYGLKAIVKHEGLERPGREHYDASKIRENFDIPEEREKIKAYAIDDADDSLKLYDLMISSFFYYTQTMPRSFQQVINTATGSQLNSLMVRGYLQQGHSIARGSEAVDYEGAISLAVPGIHRNVLRFDCVSMYPSIMKQYRIYNREKDPLGLFLQFVDFFMNEKIRYGQLAVKTGDDYYSAMERAFKILANSLYGFLGAPQLNYNFPKGAALVTEKGRELLRFAIHFITGKTPELQTESLSA